MVSTVDEANEKKKKNKRMNKNQRQTPLPMLGVPQEHQLHNHNTYAEGLVQIQTDSVISGAGWVYEQEISAGGGSGEFFVNLMLVLPRLGAGPDAHPSAPAG